MAPPLLQMMTYFINTESINAKTSSYQTSVKGSLRCTYVQVRSPSVQIENASRFSYSLFPGEARSVSSASICCKFVIGSGLSK